MARPDSNADPLGPLRGNDSGSLYFIYGKERFLVDRALEMVKGKVLQPATRDFNYDSFQGKEADAQKIAEAARTLPMMAKRRLVLVRDADEMKAAELAALIPYLEKPCAETCLVFLGEKVDARLKFFTAFKKRGVLIKPRAALSAAVSRRSRARRRKRAAFASSRPASPSWSVTRWAKVSVRWSTRSSG